MYKSDWPQNAFCLSILYCNQERQARAFGQAFWFCQQFDERINKGLALWECFIIDLIGVSAAIFKWWQVDLWPHHYGANSERSNWNVEADWNQSKSMQVWYAPTNKMASLQKILNLQNLIYCQCFEAEVKLSNMIFNHSPNYAGTKRLWVKSNGVELTTCMFPSSTPTLDHITRGQSM